MRIPVRILSFVSVAVLLSFFGKVSKVQLFEGFIRTIQDVETRNSTGFNLSEAELQIADAPSAANPSPGFSGLSGFQFTSRFIVQFIPVSIGEGLIKTGGLPEPICGFFLSTQFTAAP